MTRLQTIFRNEWLKAIKEYGDPDRLSIGGQAHKEAYSKWEQVNTRAQQKHGMTTWEKLIDAEGPPVARLIILQTIKSWADLVPVYCEAYYEHACQNVATAETLESHTKLCTVHALAIER